MLELAHIRERPEEVKAAIATLNTEAPIDEIVALDTQRRQLLTEVEALRRQRNVESKRIGLLMHEGRRTEAEQLKERMREVGGQIDALDEELRKVDAALHDALLRVPNLPDPDVPVGPDESHNVVVRQEGSFRSFPFEAVPHWTLGEELDIIDFERGVKVSGTRFYVLKGAGAWLQRALITWMIDLHIQEHGYSEVYGPTLVRRECLLGTGQLPKFADNQYFDTEDDLWLIPTAEVTITNLYRDEILAPGSLPIYHVGFSQCFRREKMSAGRETRGLKRGHQFDKVELVKFVEPNTSDDELMSLLGDAEEVCQRLEIPHRVVQMCTGDLSFTAAKKFDIEMWAPGVQEWLEVSSCSNFRTFQARRASIRYRPEPGASPEFVHTLNGSGLALPRVMIAVMENYQQADGSIMIPHVLRPYMRGREVIP
jgi:seryl-tRNA synthetase